MDLKWTDIHEIAIELVEAHPEVDPAGVRFTDLHAWVMEIPNFEDKAERSGERILEAIQAAWIEEFN